ncbi:MAG: hypothetical protein ACOCYB_09055 [Alkalispirochaeta sp.]
MNREYIHRRAAGAAPATMVLCALCALSACSGVPELPEMFDGDWQPPVLSTVAARGETEFALVFDKPVHLREAQLDPGREVIGTTWRDEELLVTVDEPLYAGELYWIDAQVEDESGNIASVLVSVYGMNEELPAVLINEVVCQGTGNHTDWVELKVLESGNLGGLTLYEGSPSYWDSRYVFPRMEVSAGEYVIVHFKPQGDPEEIDETAGDPAASGGQNHHPEAWDVWVSGGDGIPNTTGALSLSEYPGGPVMDAFLYTSKKYDASHPLRGFGLASQLDFLEELVELGTWKTSGTEVIPEDLFDPDDSTGTRSINRGPSSADESGVADTDSPADWHIGPTSSSTPGYENTLEVYEP